MSGRKVFVSSDMSVDERLLLVSEQSGMAALLWPWLLTALDDWGRCEAVPLRLKARIWPMNDAVSVAMVAEALTLFAEMGLIERYTVDKHDYLRIPPDRWWKWQTHIHRDKRESDGSRIPAPDDETTRPVAGYRGIARNRAESRGIARDSAPSPSPSPSPTPSPTLTPSDASGDPASSSSEDKRQQQQHAPAREGDALTDAEAEPETATLSEASEPSEDEAGPTATAAKRQSLTAFKRQFADAAGLAPGERGQALDAIIAAYRPRAPDAELIVEATNCRDYYASRKTKRTVDCRLLANWLARWADQRAERQRQQQQPREDTANGNERRPVAAMAASGQQVRRNGRRPVDLPDPTRDGRWADRVRTLSNTD